MCIGSVSNNNYSRPIETKNIASQNTSTPVQNAANESPVTSNQDSASQYSGQNFAQSKFDPAAKNISFDNIAENDKNNSKATQEEPKNEKTNVLVPLIGAIAGIVGGMAGAAYNEKSAEVVEKSLNKAADTLGKYGNNYSMNPFGGIDNRKEQEEADLRYKNFMKQNSQPYQTGN